jgi:hypothetical protein
VAFGLISLGSTWLAADLLNDTWGTILLDSIAASEQFNVEENERVKNGLGRNMRAIPIIISLRWN